MLHHWAPPETKSSGAWALQAHFNPTLEIFSEYLFHLVHSLLWISSRAYTVFLESSCNNHPAHKLLRMKIYFQQIFYSIRVVWDYTTTDGMEGACERGKKKHCYKLTALENVYSYLISPTLSLFSHHHLHHNTFIHTLRTVGIRVQTKHTLFISFVFHSNFAKTRRVLISYSGCYVTLELFNFSLRLAVRVVRKLFETNENTVALQHFFSKLGMMIIIHTCT